MRRKIIAGVCVALMLGMSGCANTIPALTQEEEDQIINYAADVALKYDASYENRLVDLPLNEEETEIIKPEETEEDKGMDPVKDTDTVDVSEDKGYHSSVEEFFEFEEIEVRFIEAFFADSYPEDNVNNYFALDASAGKKLLVMRFEVENKTGAEAQVDFFSVASTIKMSLNGEREIKVLSTMLTDDMATFSDVLEPDEKVTLVLLAEVAEEKATEIKTLDISLQSESKTAKISLK